MFLEHPARENILTLLKEGNPSIRIVEEARDRVAHYRCDGALPGFMAIGAFALCVFAVESSVVVGMILCLFACVVSFYVGFYFDNMMFVFTYYDHVANDMSEYVNRMHARHTHRNSPPAILSNRRIRPHGIPRPVHENWIPTAHQIEGYLRRAPADFAFANTRRHVEQLYEPTSECLAAMIMAAIIILVIVASDQRDMSAKGDMVCILACFLSAFYGMCTAQMSYKNIF